VVRAIAGLSPEIHSLLCAEITDNFSDPEQAALLSSIKSLSPHDGKA
jgi:hypothetical protein